MKFNVKDNIIIFLLGFYAYPLIEILWRGHSHLSMAITGGICFNILYNFFNCEEKLNIFEKCFIGALLITSIELISGLIVNGIMKLDVWDYSSLPFNLFGQICFTYFILWNLLSIPVSIISSFLKIKLNSPIYFKI